MARGLPFLIIRHLSNTPEDSYVFIDGIPKNIIFMLRMVESNNVSLRGYKFLSRQENLQEGTIDVIYIPVKRDQLLDLGDLQASIHSNMSSCLLVWLIFWDKLFSN